MTDLQAANARRAEAEAAIKLGHYAEAARCYVQAAEMLDKVSWSKYRQLNGPDAASMRALAAEAQNLRDSTS